MPLIQKEINVFFFSICVIRLFFHVAEHESEEEESEEDYSESLLDDASPTNSSVQLNAVTAMLVSDQKQQPNPVVPYQVMFRCIPVHMLFQVPTYM